MPLSKLPIIRIIFIYFDKLFYNNKSNTVWLGESKLFFPYFNIRAFGLWKRLPGEPRHFARRGYEENQHYGHDSMLLNYAGLSIYKYQNFIIEHGVYVGKNFNDKLSYKPIPKSYTNKKVMTFGKERVEHLLENRINAISIGPYINYAFNPLSNENFKNLKNSLGSVLIYFPNAFRDNESNYEKSKMHSESAIKLASAKKFDTIIICYHWWDLIVFKDQFKPYNDIGHYKACCGDISNIHFMNHLRMLYDLADCVSGNMYSTNFIYSYFLKKPFYIMAEYDNLEKFYTDDEIMKTAEYLTNKNNYQNLDVDFNIYEMLSSDYDFNLIKTRHQIRDILSI